ncbi:MAG: hypothetical protein FJ271_24870 [Planctomycetes bacterium]|nr:hypothetical protein [Planctomycetota bacterium]
MADQDQQSREEHWKELAALLGIESESPAAQVISAQPAPAADPGPRANPQIEAEPPQAPAFDEVEVLSQEPATENDVSRMDADESARDESHPGQARDGDESRGRRGGRRRRGRGRGGERKDDARHKPYQRQRDETSIAAETGVSPAPDFDPMADPEEANLEPPPPRSRRPDDRFTAVEAVDDIRDAVDDPLEVGDDVLDQPIPVDEDDEIDEEDAPADWNVVTWSELIASLKRFDR